MTAYLKVRPVAVAGVAKLLTAFLTPANNNNTCGRVLSLRVGAGALRNGSRYLAAAKDVTLVRLRLQDFKILNFHATWINS